MKTVLFSILIALNTCGCLVYNSDSENINETELSLVHCEWRASQRDTFVSQSSPWFNFGESHVLYSGPSKYSLIKFDISDIPRNVSVLSANLLLKINTTDENSFVTIHNITESWNENTVTWYSKPTWNTMVYSGFSTQPASENTANILDMTINWISGEVANHGLLLKQDIGNTQYSSSDTQEDPVLRVCFDWEE